MSFGDITAAIRMRELISTIASDVVDRMRPAERIGKVYLFNKSTQIAQIYFPGETLDSLVTVRFALDKIPSVQMTDTFADQGYDAPGDIVRIAGKPGAYYILDFLAGAPQIFTGLGTQPIGVISNPHSNPDYETVGLSTSKNGNEPTPAARLMPGSWGIFWGGADARTMSDTATADGASGYSAKTTLLSDTAGLLQRWQSTSFSVTAGYILTLKAKVKSTGPALSLGILTGTATNPDFFDGTSAWTDQTIVVTTDNTWREYSFSISVPTGHIRARIVLTALSGTNGAAGDIWFDDTQLVIETAPPAYVITGEIKMWPTASAPAGYLACAGGTFESTTYPVLATLLGDTFGTHSGTTYYLPDFRARSPIGIGGQASPSDGSGYSYSVGQKHGTGKHTLAGTELPAHSHAIPGGYVSPTAQAGFTASTVAAGGDYGFTYSTTAGTANSAGGGAAHNIVHPALGINFIIKT